ncbi:hypothetical protein DdX_21107 [Ditylenchus destructor]|uniref:Secreted protein n=1 Tax=Ditylenchus destructor TaxID=166010 RepID=A0AAD4QRJ2_9BILA|nr:hypothetical protein DdX_21107 [Ditylenchus destructor]
MFFGFMWKRALTVFALVFGKPPIGPGSEGRLEAGPSSRHGRMSYPEADNRPNPKRLCEDMIKKAAQKGYPMGLGPPSASAQPKRPEKPENQPPPRKKKGYPMGLSAKNAPK